MSNLRWEDVKCDSEVRLNIRKSKTDQFGAGRTVTLSKQGGRTLHCPVYFTIQYARRLGYNTVNGGFMQPRMDVNGVGRGKYKVSYGTASKDMKDVISKCGINSANYSEHSGRRGGTMTAAALGSSWLALKRKGGWKSDSAAQRYVEDAQDNTVGNLLAEEAKKKRSL